MKRFLLKLILGNECYLKILRDNCFNINIAKLPKVELVYLANNGNDVTKREALTELKFRWKEEVL